MLGQQRSRNGEANVRNVEAGQSDRIVFVTAMESLLLKSNELGIAPGVSRLKEGHIQVASVEVG